MYTTKTSRIQCYTMLITIISNYKRPNKHKRKHDVPRNNHCCRVTHTYCIAYIYKVVFVVEQLEGKSTF